MKPVPLTCSASVVRSDAVSSLFHAVFLKSFAWPLQEKRQQKQHSALRGTTYTCSAPACLSVLLLFT
jgi:hypothetical protein